MNFIYKVVFNKQIGKFVVVSENAKSAGKSSKSKKSIVGAVAGVIAATAITFSTGALAANDVDLPSTAQIAGDGNTVLNNVQVKITGNGNDVRDKGVTTVIGDNNSITGQGAVEADITRVEGNGNTIQNTQNATVMGDANFMSSAHGTMVVGNQNETNAEISTIIGSENDVLDGSANTVTGSNNSVTGNGNVAVGTSNTLLGDFLTVEGGENDVQGNTTVTQGVFNDVRADNSNVIGDSNYLRDSSYWYGEVSARNVSILGGSNDIQGSEIGVLGSNNFTNNLSGGERNNYTRYRIDSYLLGEDFAGNNVYNSSVVGSENSFGSYSYFVGDRNISFGDYNSIHGLENEIYGGYNSIFGRNNSMGLVTQYYNEINDSSDVVSVSADNNKVVGDDNIVQGSYINILGSGNLTQNVEEYRAMRMAMGDWDSFNLSEYYYSDGVYNSNITGNANIYGSDSNLLGNENRIYGGNNNAVGNYNSNYGTGNFIAGNNNEIGFYYTDWLYDEENDSWGEYTQFQENYNNSILGSANRITGNYSTIVGEYNTIDADYVNIQGHNNRAQASSYMAEKNMAETRAMSGVDLGDMSLNEYYNAPAFSSNVMGAENIYGEQTNILGSRNELYGYANSAVGNENYVFGELNNAFGQNNQIGQIEGGYEYDPEHGYYTYRETLKEVFGNNVMGYQNGVNGDDNSIIGNNNMSVGSVSIIQPEAQFMNEWDDRPTLHKEMTEDGYTEIDSSNSFVVGNWNEYSEMSNIFGGWNSAYGYNNTITGSLNSISGEANFVGGYQNDMWGTDTIIVGNSNSIYDSRNNTVVGSGNSLESVEILVRETPPDYLENIESEFDLNFDQLMDMLRFTTEMEASRNDGILLSEKNTLVGDENGIVGSGNSIFGSGNITGWYDESNPNTLINSIVAGSNNDLNGLFLGVLGSENSVEGAIVNVVGSQNVASGFLLNVIGGVNEVYGVKDGNVIGNMNSLEGQFLYVNGSQNSAFVDKAVINGSENQVYSNSDYEVPNPIHEITVSGFNNDLRDTNNSNFVGSHNSFEGSNLNVMGNGNYSDGFNQGIQDSNIVGNNNLVAGKVNVIGQDNIVLGVLPDMAEVEQDPTLLYALENISNPATTVIGSGNQAAMGSIAIGQDNTAVMGGIAIGNNTVASLGNIAIGANAIADGSSLSNDAYFIDGAAKYELAIANEGEDRRITGVAAGANANDAVNVEQLAAVFDNLDGRLNGVVTYDRDPVTDEILTDKVTLAGQNGTTITNVADAVADSDAVNLGQVNTELAVRDQKITTNTQNIATNTRDIATHTAEIANINETAVFFGRDGSGAVDKSMLLLGGENNTLTQIKNVANANDRTDAINLGQVQDMFNGLDFGGIVRYDAIEAGNYNTGKITLANTATNDVVTIGGSEVSVVVSGGTTISNVATAQNADEAVNKGLLDSEIAKVVDQVGNIKGAIQYEISEEGDVNYGASILRGNNAVMRSVNVGGNLVDGTTDQYEGGVNVNVVADGGTKIKNLANATEVDEAVNLGQLNLAIAQINDTYGEATLGAVQYEINNGVVNYAKARLFGEMVAYDTDANGVEIVSEGGTTVANVANATLADHAVNLGVLNSTIKPIDTSVKRNTTDINVINQSGVFFGAVNQDGSLAVDRSSLMLGSVDVDGNVTALTQIKNVAKANTRTDAVNLGQVQDMFDDLPTFESLAGVVKYDRNLDNSLNTNSLTLAGSAAVIETNEDGVDVVVDGGTVIKNVGEATAADHAVNKGLLDSQLALRDEKITTNSQNIAVNTSNIINLQETGVFFNRVDGLVDTSVLNLAANGTRITNVANAQTRSDAVNLGQVLDLIGEVPEQVNLDGVVRYDKNTDGTNNKDQITLAGQAAQQGKDKNGVDVVTSGGTTISNVANGIKADDAINKGQFDSALEDLKGSTVQYDRNTDGTVNNKKVTLGGAGGTVLTNVANGKIEVGSTDAVNGGQIAELIGSIEIPEQLVTQDAQTKEINVATGKDGKVVNVNGTEGDRIVAGVADGKISKTSNEAVTGKQLNNTNTAMATYLGGGAKWDEAKEEFTAPTYTVSSSKYHDVGGAIAALDARDNALDNKINDLEKNFGEKLDATNRYVRNVEKRVNAGVAASMAMEAAPYVAGKFTYAMGAANHGGEQAIGATFRRTAESGRWSLTTGFAKATEGDASVRIGISGVID